MTNEATSPEVGRVYDYVLGGTHNFAVDRQAAARIMEVLPDYPMWARLNRQFITMVADQWMQAGYTRVLDLGSGLPTQGHIHTRMPDAQLLYTDRNAFCVEEGSALVSHLPQVTYLQADLQDAAQTIATASTVFAPQSVVAIGCIGVAYLLNDDQLGELTRQLHDWCAPGSTLAISFLERTLSLDGHLFAEGLQQRLNAMHIRTYYRTPAQISAVLHPWKLRAAQPLATWVGHQDDDVPDAAQRPWFWMSGAIFDHA